MDSVINKKLFRKLEDSVYRCWPTAKHVPKNAKNVSVFGHTQSLIRANSVKNTESRREEFRRFFKSQVKKLLGNEIAESVYKQLAINHTIPTAHHFTPLSPNTLNPTLAMSLPYFGKKDVYLQNMIILACAGISFNNLWNPRGYALHTVIDEQVIENQFNLVGRSSDAQSVISTKAYGKEAKNKFNKLLLHYRSEKKIKKREFKLMDQIFEEILFSSNVLSQTRFIDQITITNFYLWKKMFAKFDKSTPNLVFFSQEDIASKLLQNFHIESETILHKVIFDQKWHKLIYKHFNNIMCAFSIERKYGTFLFWATPKNTQNRIQLFSKNGFLMSFDEKIKHELKPEVILSLLKNEEIVPSTMMTFLVLGMYYGYALTGGFDQPTYLSQIKNAHINMLRELNLMEEVENCRHIIANDIIYTRPTVAFLDKGDDRIPATVLDIIAYGNLDSWTKIVEALKKVSFHDLLYRVYPELYRDYCKDKKQELLQINENEIGKFSGIDIAIPAIIKFT